jgi:purine-nucleoside phosphorylase
MTQTTVQTLRELRAAVEQAIGPVQAGLGLVLGSGLGGVAAEITGARRIPYTALPHLVASTVAGHAGELVVGTWQGKPVVALSGRVHRYEGHELAQVTLPIRLLASLGVHTLVVTNAAGALRTALQPGDLMLIRDHINLSGGNPLIGPNDEALGPRFPDMTAAYDPELRTLARNVARRHDLSLHEGVYVGLSGPSYETPAEVRMLGLLGGDAVGMSTVAEVIVARHMGLRVLGLSCITNLGAGLGDGVLDHAHVAVVANQATERMTQLVAGVVKALPEQPVVRRLP